ncbi:hypothetical protein AB4Y43_01240 [Paraburkholderia sp. BR10872]|uniref:hypothetical protein n=1 Tax=Paraburkholderia sp. BR10872 TaxID=3236989 RepID=UPI0034D156DF
MQTTAEIVTQIKRLTSRIEEATAKGFVTGDSLKLLYQLESSVDALLSLATAEFWAANHRSAR